MSTLTRNPFAIIYYLFTFVCRHKFVHHQACLTACCKMLTTMFNASGNAPEVAQCRVNKEHHPYKRRNTRIFDYLLAVSSYHAELVRSLTSANMSHIAIEAKLAAIESAVRQMSTAPILPLPSQVELL